MKQKYATYFSGAITLMLIVSVFVSFGIKSGDQLLGDIRNKNVNASFSAIKFPCTDSDTSGSTYLTPIVTNANAAIGGQTVGDFGTMGNSVNKDRCAGSTLREYRCDTPYHQVRVDIDCEDIDLACKLDTQGLGYCG